MMNPTSLKCLSRDVVLRNVYYVNTAVSETVITGLGLIPRKDITKLFNSPFLIPECADTYFMEYLLNNPMRGILYAARYGVLMLFEYLKAHYIPCHLHCNDTRRSHHSLFAARRQHEIASLYMPETYHRHQHRKSHDWPESCYINAGIRLSTAAAMGGNIDIVRQVCVVERKFLNVDYHEMIMCAIRHGHTDVVKFCVRIELMQRKVSSSEMIREGLTQNAPTDTLIVLFNSVVDLNVRIDCRVCLDLMIEFGFRRVLTYQNIVFSASCNNFMQALFNNEFIAPEQGDQINYALALAVVCISKKASIHLLDKVNIFIKNTANYETRGFYDVDGMFEKIFIDTIKYMILGMNESLSI